MLITALLTKNIKLMIPQCYIKQWQVSLQQQHKQLLQYQWCENTSSRLWWHLLCGISKHRFLTHTNSLLQCHGWLLHPARICARQEYPSSTLWLEASSRHVNNNNYFLEDKIMVRTTLSIESCIRNCKWDFLNIAMSKKHIIL